MNRNIKLGHSFSLGRTLPVQHHICTGYDGGGFAGHAAPLRCKNPPRVHALNSHMCVGGKDDARRVLPLCRLSRSRPRGFSGTRLSRRIRVAVHRRGNSVLRSRSDPQIAIEGWSVGS